MKIGILVFALLSLVLNTFSQGQVVFAKKVGMAVDAPVTLGGTSQGPGPNFTAQLLLLAANGSLTPLVPTSTFRQAGTGAAAIADRYWEQKDVIVPGVEPGNNATFVVRYWQTSLGSYDAAAASGGSFGQSAPFTITVGGGLFPPANLTTLQATTLVFPEPSIFALLAMGAILLLVFRQGGLFPRVRSGIPRTNRCYDCFQ